MNPAFIIGLAGRARSGKNTAAAGLLAHDYQAVAFADGLRLMALGIDPTIALQNGTTTTYARLLAEIGYESAKQEPDVRRFLQRLGTEGVREVLGPDTWVRRLMGSLLPDTRYVITDVRFLNECVAIQARGGVVIRITRPGVPLLDHPSESQIDDLPVNFEITNDNRADLFQDAIKAVVNLN